MWRSSGMIDPATRPNATLSTRLARMASLLLSGAILSGAPDARAEDLKRDPRHLLPKLHGALLKNEQDVSLFERLAFMARARG